MVTAKIKMCFRYTEEKNYSVIVRFNYYHNGQVQINVYVNELVPVNTDLRTWESLEKFKPSKELRLRMIDEASRLLKEQIK